MKKHRPAKRQINTPTRAWQIEQDCFLIEHNHLPLHELQQQLALSADEIQQRREVLGLVRRQRQLHRLDQN